MTAPASTRRRPTPGDHESLRLWLRLFTCTTEIERTIGRALKREFNSSLPRFDLLAQLDRAPEGLRMGELSERTLTTGGNITWLVRALEGDGMVTRRVAADDRRSAVVRLTATGRRHFHTMAEAHEQWVVALLHPLAPADRRTLHALLGRVREQIRPTRIENA